MDKSKSRVVITGMGAVTSLGIGLSDYEKGLREGKSGRSMVEAFDRTGFPVQHACEVQSFQADKWVRRLSPESLGRSSQFSIAASRMALADANIDVEALSSAEASCSVLVGTTDGESVPLEILTRQMVDDGFDSMDLKQIQKLPADNLATAVSREFGLHGESLTFSTACAAGNYAIGTAFDMISSDEADYVLCGGSDSVCRKTFAGFYRLGTLSSDYCRPFSKDRQGILTGEGCGMLLVETLENALARKAHIYAELLGYGMNCDADHMVAPNGDSIATCMKKAHKNAGIESSQVDYICAHGTGTRANDSTEFGAIKQVFQETPPTSSIKSMLGHSMGAASALGAIACALAIEKGFIPPTINFTEPDPEIEIDCIQNKSRSSRLDIVQNNAFAFGGNNAILIMSRYSPSN